MKERPIIFSTDMVKAILDSKKTQTRRVIKPTPVASDDMLAKEVPIWLYPKEFVGYCLYGQVGDRLWVRETWKILDNTTLLNDLVRVEYKADGQIIKRRYGDIAWNEGGFDLPVIQSAMEDGKWKPAHHLPHIISRITLEITEVRVERVQEITAYDALLEGIGLPVPKGCEIPLPPPEYEGWSEERRESWIKGQARATYFSRCADAQDHIDAFKKLWDSINAERGYGWEVNPFVWCISFKEVTNDG